MQPSDAEKLSRNEKLEIFKRSITQSGFLLKTRQTLKRRGAFESARRWASALVSNGAKLATPTPPGRRRRCVRLARGTSPGRPRPAAVMESNCRLRTFEKEESKIDGNRAMGIFVSDNNNFWLVQFSNAGKRSVCRCYVEWELK
ncbi:hypothetical protein L596_025356 [Steinernema carpocapsae]|uniref:Uncharacterized protein n=1 Tax=Steinernema carpocapsae TaxID=34508 RepID=A0A4U5M7J0_STECR|nr:hypothetical protein L596_025356 [Steinernema carpocapsae]